jgi:hypothetical protein
MTDPREELREDIERLGKSIEVEVKALARAFEAKVNALISGHSEGERTRRIAEAGAGFERLVRAKSDEIGAALQARFGSPPASPRRRPYVENFPLGRHGHAGASRRTRAA